MSFLHLFLFVSNIAEPSPSTARLREAKGCSLLQRQREEGGKGKLRITWTYLC